MVSSVHMHLLKRATTLTQSMALWHPRRRLTSILCTLGIVIAGLRI